MALPSSSSSSSMRMTTTTTTTTADDVTYLNQTLIPSLPNDVSIRILARLPRSQHPSLSLVSKAFRSLLSSPHFFTIRSLVNSTETFLFITLCYNKDPTDHFYTIHHRRLVPLPPIPSCRVSSAYATLGPRLYVLGGLDHNGNGTIIASAAVWIFDCRFNKWSRGPSMHVPRKSPIVGVVDGKMYVIGGGDHSHRNNNEILAEVYDPDMGTWEAVKYFEEMRIEKMPIYASAVFRNKIYAMNGSGLAAYDVETRVWEYMDDDAIGGFKVSCCVINGVLYWLDYYRGRLNGFDLKEGHWKEVRGVEIEMHMRRCANLKMVNFKGKLIMFYERKRNANGYCKIRWMGIDVKKDKNGELIGNVCFDKLLPISRCWFMVIDCSAVAF